MHSIRVSERRARAIRAGQLWVYRTDVRRGGEKASPGDPCRILDGNGRFLAVGYFNPQSEIRARILAREDRQPGMELIEERLDEALRLRTAFSSLRDTDALRLVNGEGDGLPGLSVDRFRDLAVVQINTAGMVRHAGAIAEALLARPGIRSVVLRGDSSGLKREGVEMAERVLGVPLPAVCRFREGRVLSRVTPSGGQKTGGYLDIRAARLLVAGMARERRTLDVFCHGGLFGLHALAGGASAVTFVESGKGPLALLADNLADQGWHGDRRVELRPGDAVRILAALQAEGRRFDLIILDPPPYVRRRVDLARGMTAYRELNCQGLSLLTPGGLLLSASCSAPVTGELFAAMLAEASARAGVAVTLMAEGGQDLDHPLVPAMPETRYLHYALLRRTEDAVV